MKGDTDEVYEIPKISGDHLPTLADGVDLEIRWLYGTNPLLKGGALPPPSF